MIRQWAQAYYDREYNGWAIGYYDSQHHSPNAMEFRRTEAEAKAVADAYNASQPEQVPRALRP